MAADLVRPINISASTTDETPPVEALRVGTEAFDRWQLRPSGVYTGDGTAAPAQNQPRSRYTRKSTAVAETYPRIGSPIINSAILTQSQLHLVAIELPANLLITGAGFVTGTTAADTPANWWYVLADASRVVKAVTADQLTAAMAANTDLPVAFGATYTTPTAGLYYVGIMVKGTAAPSLMGVTSSATMSGIAPISNGTSNTAASVPVALAATLTAITASVAAAYAYLY